MPWRSPLAALLLAARQLPGSPVSEAGHADHGQRLADSLGDVDFPYASGFWPERDVFSATLMCGNSAYDCTTRPRSRRCGGIPVTSRPDNRTVPDASGTKPATARSAVVFPEPLGPRTATSSPASTVRLKPSRTVFRWYVTVA
nr:hypothetical protein [Fodinicola feengrottensis]